MGNKSRNMHSGVANSQLKPLTPTKRSLRLDQRDKPTWLRSRHASLLVILSIAQYGSADISLLFTLDLSERAPPALAVASEVQCFLWRAGHFCRRNAVL